MVPVKCEHCCSSGKPGFERNIPANKSANIKMYFFRQVGSIIVNVIAQSKCNISCPRDDVVVVACVSVEGSNLDIAQKRELNVELCPRPTRAPRVV